LKRTERRGKRRERIVKLTGVNFQFLERDGGVGRSVHSTCDRVAQQIDVWASPWVAEKGKGRGWVKGL